MFEQLLSLGQEKKAHLAEEYEDYFKSLPASATLDARNKMFGAILMSFVDFRLGQGMAQPAVRQELNYIAEKLVASRVVGPTLHTQLQDMLAQKMAKRKLVQGQIAQTFLSAVGQGTFATDGAPKVLQLDKELGQFSEQQQGMETWQAKQGDGVCAHLVNRFYDFCSDRLKPLLPPDFTALL